MDIRVFKTFIEVAENKHFGRAAEKLYITQAAVSARIKQLEDFYDSQLLIRDKNNLRLTPSGEALLAHAHLMVSQMEQSKLALSIANQQKVNFNIAATPNVWDAFLSSRIQETLSLFSNITLSSEISVREAIQRKIDDRTLDIGLLTDPIKDDDFVNVLIGHFDLSLVGTEPELPCDCENYTWVDWGITFQKEHTLHHKITPYFKTSTAIIALEVLLTNGGFAYLPTELISHFVEQKQLYLIDSPLQIKRPIYLVYKKSTGNLAMIDQLSELYMHRQ